MAKETASSARWGDAQGRETGTTVWGLRRTDSIGLEEVHEELGLERIPDGAGSERVSQEAGGDAVL